MADTGSASVEIVGGTVVARFRDYAGLVDAWVQAKAIAGLSNEMVEHIGGLAPGQLDKVQGVSRTKGAGVFMFNTLSEVYALEFEVRFNAEALAKMRPRWQGRDTSQIRVDARRLSHAAIKQAKKLIFSEMGKAGGKARLTKLTAATRRRVARQGAAARWSKRRRWRGNRPKVDLRA